MSAGYRAIQWSPYKRWYDLSAALLVLWYLAAFVAAGKWAWRGTHAISNEVLVIRALGTCAFVLLTLILCIGPVCRINPRFLPLLYNRRHLGVMTFLIGLGHAAIAIGFYHGFGKIGAPASLLTSNTRYATVSGFPFEMLGVIALAILFVMAATSHGFWLKNLSPGTWKGLHMMVYPAWGLLVGHVALGALQAERSVVYPVLVGGAVIVVGGLHLLAGRREVRIDRVGQKTEWLEVAGVDEIAQDRATIVCASGGERIAVFRYGNKVSAISNVCAHQGGPLGEGKIIDGCVTCPWHGYQYRAGDGCSPPPFTEKVATYPIRIEDGRVYVRAKPLPPGTAVEPAVVEEEQYV